MDVKKLYNLQFLSLFKRRTPKPALGHYKRSTPPISVPLNKIFLGTFPLSMNESINHFKSRHDVMKFQHDLLATLPFYPYADSSGRSSEVLKTYIDDTNFINEFVIYPNKSTKLNYSNANHLIMIHGYGSGLGLYLKNFKEITADNWIIHAIDLLGYGCSSRPQFSPTNFEETESWFHDSFQKWMESRKIPSDKTMVLAHSMGAYLMASYGIKKPDFCKKLVMVSPAAITNHKSKVVIPKYFERLWERNISPFSLVRNAQFYGSKLVSGWTYRRFAKLPIKERDLLHKYVYGIFQSPGSGEYMLNYLLKPGAEPRKPLKDRPFEKVNFDYSWWYGTEDWMNVEGGHECTGKLRNVGKKSNVIEIANAGHHIYLDNSKAFNKFVLKEMNEMSK